MINSHSPFKYNSYNLCTRTRSLYVVETYNKYLNVKFNTDLYATNTEFLSNISSEQTKFIQHSAFCTLQRTEKKKTRWIGHFYECSNEKKNSKILSSSWPLSEHTHTNVIVNNEIIEKKSHIKKKLNKHYFHLQIVIHLQSWLISK